MRVGAYEVMQSVQELSVQALLLYHDDLIDTYICTHTHTYIHT